MLLDARRLRLINLGRGYVITTDVMGSVRMYTFGPLPRWTDPLPDGNDTFWALKASAFPKETRWS